MTTDCGATDALPLGVQPTTDRNRPEPTGRYGKVREGAGRRRWQSATATNARIARRLACSYPPKERLNRQVNAHRDSLRRRRRDTRQRPTLRFASRQARCLLGERRYANVLSTLL